MSTRHVTIGSRPVLCFERMLVDSPIGLFRARVLNGRVRQTGGYAALLSGVALIPTCHNDRVDRQSPLSRCTKLGDYGKKASFAALNWEISPPSYQTKFPKACECLERDKEVLFTFYDFPAQHWPHLRTTNPIESTFATVRLRTHRTKGCGSRIATLTMVFKLGLEAQKHWRRLNGPELVAKVVTGVKFVDGEEATQQAA
jgi:hypothetical protein